MDEKLNYQEETEELLSDEELLRQQEEAMQEEEEAQKQQEVQTVTKADFEEFDESTPHNPVVSNERLNMLKDLQLNVYIELGRTKMKIKDILELERGYVIELDKMASEPVDIFVNNKKIAEGEVVVIDKHFGIRIISLCDAANRLQGLY